VPQRRAETDGARRPRGPGPMVKSEPSHMGRQYGVAACAGARRPN
jgi:hypothetical protein